MDAGDDLARKGQALLATSVTSAVLAIGTCGVRLLARRQAKRRLWWDDYSIIAATVCFPISPLPFSHSDSVQTTNTPRQWPSYQ